MQAIVLATELLLFICLGCHGLQLQVNTNVNTSDYCAILSCHENIAAPPAAVDNKTSNDLDSAKAASDVHRLSSLEVYRITGESFGILVAGVTEKNNKLTQQFDGKGVGNGFLNSTEAQLTLSLRGQDCQASFRCQALSVDAEGQTHLNLISLITTIDRPPHPIIKERTKTRSAKPKAARAAPNDNLEDLPKCMPSKEDPNNECEVLVLAQKNYSTSCDKIPGLISTFQHLESTYGNMKVPSSCEQGGLIPPLRSYFQYLVVNSNHHEKHAQFPILCDTHTDRGGWTVIQRRVSGDVDFYRGWSEYKLGFGSFSGDFWLGLDKIYDLISNGSYQLRIDLKYKDKTYFAQYTPFYITGELSNYTLNIGSYVGNAEDKLSYHNGMPFSTYDRDNDHRRGNCAKIYTGAWWYKSCFHSNLNGKWNKQSNKGVIWEGLSDDKSVTFSEMKIRKMGVNKASDAS